MNEIIEMVLIILIFIALILFHEFCHWIPAKFFKVSKGFIKPSTWFGGKLLVGLEVPCKKMNLKQRLIVLQAGVIIPLLVCSAGFILTNRSGWIILIMFQLLASLGDLFGLILTVAMIRSEGFNNPIKDTPSLALSTSIDWKQKNEQWINEIEKLIKKIK